LQDTGKQAYIDALPNSLALLEVCSTNSYWCTELQNHVYNRKLF